jgi:hypothetical protein
MCLESTGFFYESEFVIENLPCKFANVREALERIKREGIYEVNPLPAMEKHQFYADIGSISVLRAPSSFTSSLPSKSPLKKQCFEVALFVKVPCNI